MNVWFSFFKKKREQERVTKKKKSPLIFILNFLHFQRLWQQVKLLSWSRTLSKSSLARAGSAECRPTARAHNGKDKHLLSFRAHTAPESFHRSRVFPLRCGLTFPHREINHKSLRTNGDRGTNLSWLFKTSKGLSIYTGAPFLSPSPLGPKHTVPISPHGTGPRSLCGTHLWVPLTSSFSWPQPKERKAKVSPTKRKSEIPFHLIYHGWF